MNIAFVSNYLNHHQIPFCQVMSSIEDVSFTFIQVYDMEEERVKMGWGVELTDYPFAISYSADPDRAKSIILDYDVVLFGGVDDESFIEPRLEKGGLTIRISERIYKDGQWKFISPRGLMKKYHDHVRYRDKEVYLLCAGGYVASDFSLIGAYPDKMYTWGYFPAVHEYNIDEIIEKKKTGVVSMLWAGRMIDWKHPDHALMALKAAVDSCIECRLTMIGDGPMLESLKEYAKDNNLDEYVEFLGFMKPADVRRYMQQAGIYLFTSDFKEGWGAVLNESMNEGCAVIASSGIGAVPAMLRHGENALVYKNGDTDELCQMTVELLKDSTLREKLGRKAYESMISTWNPEVAARRLYQLIKGLLQGQDMHGLYLDGPVSKASVVKPSKGYKYTRRS